MMVDVNLKVPALEMLLKYTASGIGAVAGPMLAPWKARREAEAKLIETETEAGSLKLIAAAQADARHSLITPDETGRGVLDIGPEGIAQRIEFQEKKRQANIAFVVREAAAGLRDREVLDREPDPDWTARFFDCVQDVSSEDMRKLWARVLSGEVESPERTSLRTLDILKNMTSRDAELFQNICGHVIHDSIFDFDNLRANYQVLSYDNLLILQDAGLINAAPMLVKEAILDDHSNEALLVYQNAVLKISAEGRGVNFDIPNFPLTAAGMQLRRFAKCEPRMDYLELFSRFLHGKNCTLSFAQLLEEHPDGAVTHSNPFVPIEPAPQPSENAAS